MTRTCTQEVNLLVGDPWYVVLSTIQINNVVQCEHYWLGKLFLFFVFWILCHQTLQLNLSCCSLHFIHWRLPSPANCIFRTCPPCSCSMHVDDLINTLAFQFFDLPISSATHSPGHNPDLSTLITIYPQSLTFMHLTLRLPSTSYPSTYILCYLYFINCLTLLRTSILLSKYFSNIQLDSMVHQSKHSLVNTH